MSDKKYHPIGVGLVCIALAILMFATNIEGLMPVAFAQRGTVPPPPPPPPPPLPQPNSTNNSNTTINPGSIDYPCFDALAFHSERDGNRDLYMMNGDGSGLSRLTYLNPVDEHPAPSPDGRTIAFDSTRDQANPQIYLMNVDGTNVRRITSDNFANRTPHWSLDGRRIAFESNRDGSFQIWTMNFDGSDLRQLTKTAPSTGENTRPQWSQDGSRIAFTSTRDGHEEIYVMSASDGANQSRLTNTPGNKNSAHPTWSRDSQRLAFESDRTGNHEIFLMNANGTNVRQITKTDSPAPPKQNRYPYWIPSCDDRIVFASDRLPGDYPNLRIWVTDPDGFNQRRLLYEQPRLLLNLNANDEHPAWSGAPLLPLPVLATPTP